MLSNIVIASIGLVVVVLLAIAYGKSSSKRKQSESNVKRLNRDKKISSEPYIDNPAGGMRPKK